MNLSEALIWRKELKREGKRLVVTNGCFDLLHRGHVTYLSAARALGDALLVLVNSDHAVKALKGPTRPLQCDDDRAFILEALKSVDGTLIFDSPRCDKELKLIAPDIYVKGGDYTISSLNEDERNVLLALGCDIKFIPFVSGHSTSSIIAKM